MMRHIAYFFLLHMAVCAEDLWNGKEYVHHSDLQYRWATSYIQKFHLVGNERILDIGCGDGRITATLAYSFPASSVLGVDISDSMLQSAQNHKLYLNNLDFAKRDATNLGFKEAFDFAMSFSCLHWISDHVAVLEAMYKALKPGGTAFLYFATDHGHDRIDQAIDAIVYSPKWISYFSDYSQPFFIISPEQFTSYAQQTGFTIQRIENITVNESFVDKQAFCAWMEAWMSQLKRLPKHLHREFLEEIVDYYASKRAEDPSKPLHYIGFWSEVDLLKP